MKKIISFILGTVVALNLSISVANAAADKVRIAIFTEWPTPNQEDKVKGVFEKALGVPVEWIRPANGVAMTEGMAAGDIDISYSQGLLPFINAVKAKTPMKLVDIAMEYGMGGQTCIVSNASGITKANATELEGKKVAVPLGTMGEYVFNETMKIVGADISKMEVIEMDPPEGAAALVEGNVAMACLFGGNSIDAALAIGSRLITEGEARENQILGIDITSVTDKFMQENPGMVRTFVEVTHEANARYRAGKTDLSVVAGDAGMDLAGVKKTIGDFKFLTPQETKTSMESGGTLDKFLQGFNTPNGSVDTSFLPL
jgi:taurine transport system substrate-binding protein